MRIWGTLLIAALVAVPATAAGEGGNYTPDDPTKPTPAGSSVAAECEGTDLRLEFDVAVTQPTGTPPVSGEVELVLTGSGTVIDLGALVDGAASGAVSWPLDDTPASLPGELRVSGDAVPPLPVSVAVSECDPSTSALAWLARTGSDAPVVPIAAGALIALTLGGVLLWRRARRTRGPAER